MKQMELIRPRSLRSRVVLLQVAQWSVTASGIQCNAIVPEESVFAHAQHDAGTTRPLREGYFLRTLVRGVRLNNSHRIDLNRLLARIKIFNTFRSTLNLLTRAS